MKKWLIIAGFVVAFAIGSLSSGLFFPAKGNYNGFNDAMYNRGSEGHMMYYGHGPGMMNRMGNSNGMHGMGYSEIPGHMMGNWNGNHMHMMGNMHGGAMYGQMPMMPGMMADFFGEAAKALDMPADQLQSELQSGKSLGAIAEQKGLMKE
ncbi:hypothetical protein [Sporosarcina sp. HYO08]|uniref:hypothetical protein n=1 Tax=Sporosarcina sp. HYO08 TaxID=1759557 RepID=UPI00079B5691|nr:hypothetical protein [Sporosarcina sp. HYO08]KXH81840.1 hypothetical protein AU377_06130 [Sporosarcina sp. HYO08]